MRVLQRAVPGADDCLRHLVPSKEHVLRLIVFIPASEDRLIRKQRERVGFLPVIRLEGGPVSRGERDFHFHRIHLRTAVHDQGAVGHSIQNVEFADGHAVQEVLPAAPVHPLFYQLRRLPGILRLPYPIPVGDPGEAFQIQGLGGTPGERDLHDLPPGAQGAAGGHAAADRAGPVRRALPEGVDGVFRPVKRAARRFRQKISRRHRQGERREKQKSAAPSFSPPAQKKPERKSEDQKERQARPYPEHREKKPERREGKRRDPGAGQKKDRRRPRPGEDRRKKDRHPFFPDGGPAADRAQQGCPVDLSPEEEKKYAEKDQRAFDKEKGAPQPFPFPEEKSVQKNRRRPGRKGEAGRKVPSVPAFQAQQKSPDPA